MAGPKQNANALQLLRAKGEGKAYALRRGKCLRNGRTQIVGALRFVRHGQSRRRRSNQKKALIGSAAENRCVTACGQGAFAHIFGQRPAPDKHRILSLIHISLAVGIPFLGAFQSLDQMAAQLGDPLLAGFVADGVVGLSGVALDVYKRQLYP